MSSWNNHLFIISLCPSLFLITFLALKSALSEISIVTPAFFHCWYNGISFSIPLLLICLWSFLNLKWVYKTLYTSCFVSAVSAFYYVFRQFTLKVIINIIGLISTIFVSVFHSLPCSLFLCVCVGLFLFLQFYSFRLLQF